MTTKVTKSSEEPKEAADGHANQNISKQDAVKYHTRPT